MTQGPEPMRRRTFLQALITGDDEAGTGRVAFHPLLARTALLLAAFTATVSAAARALNGTWQVSTVLPIVLAGLLVLRIALRPAVRHRWYAVAAFAVVAVAVGRRTDVHGEPLIWNTLAAALAGAAAFAAVTHLPQAFFSRRNADRPPHDD